MYDLNTVGNSTGMADLFINLNTSLSGYLVIGLIILMASVLFIILIMRDTQVKDAFMITSFITSIISLLFLFLGMIAASTFIAILLVVGIAAFFMVKLKS